MHGGANDSLWDPAAGDEVGAWTLPDGDAFYDYALDHHATTEPSAFSPRL